MLLGVLMSGLVVGATEYFKNMIVSPDVIYVNDEKLDMSDREFELQNALDNDTDRTYIPLRKVAEITGCEVVWDGANDRIDITSPNIKELTRLKEIIKELESKNSSLEQENYSLKRKIDKLTNDNTQLLKEINSLTNENNKLKGIVDDLSSENALLKEENANLLNKNLKLQSIIDTLTQENKELKNALSSLSILKPLVEKQGGNKEAYKIHSTGFIEQDDNEKLFNLLKAIYN
jgi:myosin heavy subunit